MGMTIEDLQDFMVTGGELRDPAGFRLNAGGSPDEASLSWEGGKLLVPPFHLLEDHCQVSGAGEGISLRWNLRLTNSPWQEEAVVVGQEVIDGDTTVATNGELNDPDVEISCDYARYCRYLAGDLTALEAIEGGRLDGDLDDLMVHKGILEIQSQMRLTVGCGPALQWWTAIVVEAM